MNRTATNAELMQKFESDGFVVFPQFVMGEELTELISNVERFIERIVPDLPPENAFFEDKSDSATLKQIQQMGDHDPWFHELLTASRFREVAETLLDGPVVPKNLQYFNKPPGVGLPTPPHQDGYYFMLDPCEAVTMWFALDDVDEENGCLRYAPGSHKLGMREHARTQTLGFSQGIVDYPTDTDREFEVALPAKPGDLLVHHALAIHRADGNLSTVRSRRALGFIYYSERARVNVDAHAAYQQQLAAEMHSRGRVSR